MQQNELLCWPERVVWRGYVMKDGIVWCVDEIGGRKCSRDIIVMEVIVKWLMVVLYGGCKVLW